MFGNGDDDYDDDDNDDDYDDDDNYDDFNDDDNDVQNQLLSPSKVNTAERPG